MEVSEILDQVRMANNDVFEREMDGIHEKR
jgi:hypothetical protein